AVADIGGGRKLHEQVKPVLTDKEGSSPQRQFEPGDERDRMRRLGGKIKVDPCPVLPCGERPGERLKGDRRSRSCPACLPEHERGGKRRVAAELHFLCRGKPSQVPALRAGMKKRGLRMFQFGCNLLHPRGIGRSVQDADRSRVPAKRESGKGIDNVQLATHGNGLVCRFIKGPGRKICRRFPMNDRELNRTCDIISKITKNAMSARLRAPHGARRGKDIFPQRYWQDFRFKLILISGPPQGRPVGGGGSHRSGERDRDLFRILHRTALPARSAQKKQTYEKMWGW